MLCNSVDDTVYLCNGSVLPHLPSSLRVNASYCCNHYSCRLCTLQTLACNVRVLRLVLLPVRLIHRTAHRQCKSQLDISRGHVAWFRSSSSSDGGDCAWTSLSLSLFHCRFMASLVSLSFARRLLNRRHFDLSEGYLLARCSAISALMLSGRLVVYTGFRHLTPTRHENTRHDDYCCSPNFVRFV